MKPQSYLSYTAVLMLFNGYVCAQQDSIKYQNMKVFEIADGKKTNEFFVKNQKTFTIDGRLIREINFDDSTRHILNYTFYFYKDGKLFTEEFHDKNDSIRYIIRHKYDSKGLEEEIDRLEWIKGKMKTSGRTVFVYDKAGLKIGMKESGSRKKPFRVTSYIYSSGNLVQEQSMNPSNKTILRIAGYEYEPDGKVKFKKVFDKQAVDTVLIQTETYRYNEKGQVKKAEIKDPQGNVIHARFYEYFADGSIRNYYEKDAGGKYVLYYSFLIKYHKINLGAQKSYFDKN